MLNSGFAWSEPWRRPQHQPQEPYARQVRTELLSGSLCGDPSCPGCHRGPPSLRHSDGPEALPGAWKRKRGHPNAFVDMTDQWKSIELEPFRSLIRQGKDDLVMTAHIFNKNLDPAWPTALSAKTITDLLRRDMGYGKIEFVVPTF